MKRPTVIEYIKIAIPNSTEFELRSIGTSYCCPDMAHQFREGRISFGNRREEAHYNRVAEVFIRVDNGAQIIDDKNVVIKKNTDLAIPYCPWCKEPILTHEIEITSPPAV